MSNRAGAMMRTSSIPQSVAVAVMLLLAACNTPRILARKAAAGDAEAQYAYACHLLDSAPSAPQPPCTAAHLLKESTLAGHRNAPALLGILYTTGRAWPKNFAHARFYLSIASDRHHSKAQLMLALLYAKGLGTALNPEKAVEHLRYAAMQGSPRAALLMFFCFWDAFGVPRSPSLALGWLQNAADLGSQDAPQLLKIDPKSPNFSKKVDFLRKKLDFFPQNR